MEQTDIEIIEIKYDIKIFDLYFDNNNILSFEGSKNDKIQYANKLKILVLFQDGEKYFIRFNRVSNSKFEEIKEEILDKIMNKREPNE